MKMAMHFIALAIAAATLCGNIGAGSPRNGKVIVAYVTSWSDVTPDPAKMTHINYAFGHVNGTFDGVRIDNPERLRSVASLKAQAPELRVMLSIGGWQSGRFSEMAAHKANRLKFAADCARVLKDYGLDGIDIDWEYPGSDVAGISSSPADRDNYTLLMRDIRRKIGKRKSLTMASSAAAGHIDFRAIMPYVDFVNIMTYDMATPPRRHSAMYRSDMTGWLSCEDAVEAHLKAGLPVGKLVLGIPFYGRGKTPLRNFNDYNKIIELSEEFSREWDDVAKSPYISYGGEMICGYDTPQSIAIKCAYIHANGLLGAMYWDYAGDDEAGTLRNAVFRGIFDEDRPVNQTTLGIVDKDATPETKALLANLFLIQRRGVMFGHHDYPSYGVGWRGDENRSDVKDIVGDHPAVYSLDMWNLDDRKVELIKQAHRRGGVGMLVWHQSNPLTEGPDKKYPEGTAWDNTKVVDQILTEGSEMNIKYKKRLDEVAGWFSRMRDDEGQLIPVIFRPLHEHTQAWNWWGSKATTEEEFIAFWRFIVSYLRDEKGVHNVLYAISPQMDEVYPDPKARLMFRWPGNEWVDFLGMDCYHFLNQAAWVSNLTALTKLGVELNMPVGVTETGLERNHKADYWTADVLPAMKGKPCSMVVAWRNDNPRHAYGPYPSDSTAEDFKIFYGDQWTIFESDLSAMYVMPPKAKVK